MNTKERAMMYDIYNLTNAVPDIRNNMSMGDLSRFRYDTLEINGYLQTLTYSLLMCSGGEQMFKEEFDKDMKEVKEFIETRNKEGWSWKANYVYRFAHGAQ